MDDPYIAVPVSMCNAKISISSPRDMKYLIDHCGNVLRVCVGVLFFGGSVLLFRQCDVCGRGVNQILFHWRSIDDAIFINIFRIRINKMHININWCGFYTRCLSIIIFVLTFLVYVTLFQLFEYMVSLQTTTTSIRFLYHFECNVYF